MSGVDELIFHGITGDDLIPPQRASAALSSLLDTLAEDDHVVLSTLLDAFEHMGFEWGESDGS